MDTLGGSAVLCSERSGVRARQKLAREEDRMPGREDAPAGGAEVPVAQRPVSGEERGTVLRREVLWEDQEEPFIPQLLCLNRTLVTGTASTPAADMHVPEDTPGRVI